MNRLNLCNVLSLLIITAIPASASIRRSWLSKYASYEVVGELEEEPLPGFLTTPASSTTIRKKMRLP